MKPAVRTPAGENIPQHVERILRLLGENPSRPGLRETPQRVARALRELVVGYQEDPVAILSSAAFPASDALDSSDAARAPEGSGLILVKGMDLFSLCEHHLLPFFGACHVAYVPAKKIVGLSKIPQAVSALARRLQIQERLTRQIADALEEALSPQGVAVVLECRHLCLEMRGQRPVRSPLVTSVLRGVFRTDPSTRREFLGLIR